MSFGHAAVHRNALSGADDEGVPRAKLCDGHGDLFAVPKQSCGLGSKRHQALEGIGGFSLGARFQQLSDRDEGKDHGGGFKIQSVERVVCGIKLSDGQVCGHGEQDVHAVAKGGRRAEGDQRIHIGR